MKICCAVILGILLCASASAQNTGTGTVTVTVAPAAMTITTPATLPGATVGVAYSQAIATTGAVGGVTCAITTQTASASISACVISWTPTVVGTFSIAVKATDSTTPTAQTATQTFSITVVSSTLVVNSATVKAVASVPWSVQLTASGGVAPYTWSSTTLPTNVTLTPAGLMSGVFAIPGSITIAFSVKDSAAPVAHNITITWTASVTPGVVGVNVYKASAATGPWGSRLNGGPVSVQPFLDLSVKAGETDYYALTSVLPSGAESALSLVASATVPTP